MTVHVVESEEYDDPFEVEVTSDREDNGVFYEGMKRIEGHCEGCRHNNQGWCKHNRKWAYLFVKERYGRRYSGDCEPLKEGDAADGNSE